MRTYTFEVEEYHIVRKTYNIEAPTKRLATKMAKTGNWDDATPDEPTGEIAKIVIKNCKSEGGQS